MRRLSKIGVGVLSGIIILALVIQFLILLPLPSQPLRAKDYQKNVAYTNVPTIMIPGWGGNSTTYRKMVKYYQTKHYAQKVMTVWVSPSGNIKTTGRYTGQKNALIQVLFNWNYNATYHPQVGQLQKVLHLLHDKYHVNTMNVIAHSYGGTEFMHAYMGDKKLQKNISLNKLVFLGVPVEESFGVKEKFVPDLNKESTDKNFHRLEREMKNWQPQFKITIYNIMGGSDQSVPRIQSEMLKSLIASHPQIDYHQVIIPHTSHFQLHSRQSIQQRIANILWRK